MSFEIVSDPYAIVAFSRAASHELAGTYLETRRLVPHDLDRHVVGILALAELAGQTEPADLSDMSDRRLQDALATFGWQEALPTQLKLDKKRWWNLGRSALAGIDCKKPLPNDFGELIGMFYARKLTFRG